jgi:hypothetical protein
MRHFHSENFPMANTQMITMWPELRFVGIFGFGSVVWYIWLWSLIWGRGYVEEGMSWWGYGLMMEWLRRGGVDSLRHLLCPILSYLDLYCHILFYAVLHYCDVNFCFAILVYIDCRPERTVGSMLPCMVRQGGVEEGRGWGREGLSPLAGYEMCKCSGCNRSLIHVSMQFLTHETLQRFTRIWFSKPTTAAYSHDSTNFVHRGICGEPPHNSHLWTSKT